MRYSIGGLALIVTAGLLAAQHDVPGETKKSITEMAQEVPATRFNPAPMVVIGASGDIIALSVSADGKRIASVGGTFNPASGFISVLETESKKELFSLRLLKALDSVCISPDGKLVAFTGQSGEFKILKVDGGKTLLSKKLDGAAQLAFSPDGLSIATVTQAKTVQIWEASSGEEQAKLQGATASLRCVAFSADGKKLVAGGGALPKGGLQSVVTDINGSIFVWSVATQRLLQKLESDAPVPVQYLAVSPDGTLVAGASADQQVRIWELASAKIKTTIMVQQPTFGVAFSQNQTLAGAIGDGTIQLWNSTSGDELGILSRHEGFCRTVSFIAGGKKLVSGGGSRSLKLWDVVGKKEIATLRQDELPDARPIPLALAASDDGSLVALATEDGAVVLRDGRTGVLKATLKSHEDAVTCVAFSPDGKTLASGSSDKTIKLWDTTTAKELATLTGHANWVYVLAFSHDGKTLASGSYDKSVKLWDTETGRDKGTIEAHRGSVRAVAFSPDDKTIASGGSDKIVKLWNVAARGLKHAMKGHAGAVRTLSFSSNGKALASGGEDGFVKFWNPATGEELVATKNMHKEAVTAVAFAGDRLLLSGAADGAILQWDAATGEMMESLQGHNGGVCGIAVAAGENEFLSAGGDRIVKRFRRDTTSPIRLFTGHTGDVNCLSISPDGKRFVSCGNWPEGDKTVRVWDVQKGTEILKIEQPEQTPMAIFSPDGKYILSGTADMNAYLWNATTGGQIRMFQGHTAMVVGLAFNADGSRILTSSKDKTVRLWETATGRELQEFTGHTEMVRRLAFHPDGKHALSGGRDGFVRMWELKTAREVRQFQSPDGGIDCVAVSRDGKFLAVGGTMIVLFSIESGKTLSEFSELQFASTGLAFSADGKRILASGYDGSARLLDRETGRELFSLRGHREVLWDAEFSPDGKWILTGGGGANVNGKYSKGSDHAIQLWKMPDEKAIEEYSAAN